MATLAENLNVPNTGAFVATPESLPCQGAGDVVVFVDTNLSVNMLGQISEDGVTFYQINTNNGANKSKPLAHAAGRTAVVFHTGGAAYFRVFFYQSGAGPATVTAKAYQARE